MLLADYFGNDTLGSTTISYLIIYIGRDLEYTSPIDLWLLSSEYLWAPEDGIYLIATIQATLYLSPTLHDKQAVLAALGRLLL
jgi:hypothetical protein